MPQNPLTETTLPSGDAQGEAVRVQEDPELRRVLRLPWRQFARPQPRGGIQDRGRGDQQVSQEGCPPEYEPFSFGGYFEFGSPMIVIDKLQICTDVVLIL